MDFLRIYSNFVSFWTLQTASVTYQELLFVSSANYYKVSAVLRQLHTMWSKETTKFKRYSQNEADKIFFSRVKQIVNTQFAQDLYHLLCWGFKIKNARSLPWYNLLLSELRMQQLPTQRIYPCKTSKQEIPRWNSQLLFRFLVWIVFRSGRPKKTFLKYTDRL